MVNGEAPKPLFWVGSSKKDLKRFPLPVRRTIGFALFHGQMGEKHVDAKPLKGFSGAGLLEIVADHDGNTFRAVYTVKFQGAVYVLHAFQKKSKKGAKTPKAELDLIRKRLKTAEEHYEKWRTTQKQKDAKDGKPKRRGQ
jgi:phage-related protein